MGSTLGHRVFGLETEFGCLVADPALGDPEQISETLKDYLFGDARVGLLDRHSRDEVFEPAGSGGFLLNGGRLYVDAVGSHLEYATAECRSLWDLIANDRAGQRHIVRALHDLGLSDAVSVYNNSVDHFGGHTFGCHENYLVQADDGMLTVMLQPFLGFLVTRQIFAGVGRVGGHRLVEDADLPSYGDVSAHPVDYIWVSHFYGVQPDPKVAFQLSQRADHILKTVASRVRFNRAIINPKWEHYYTHDGRTRLHLLFGEANVSEYAFALKVGTTALVLDVLEERAEELGRLALRHPLLALRQVSRDPTYRWVVERANGETISAVDLQREFLGAAETLRGRDAETDWVLDNWRLVLDALEHDPLSLADRLDWPAKAQIVRRYCEEFGVGPHDDALHSVDLEFHNIDPDQSLGHAWFESFAKHPLVSPLQIVEAMADPPSNTRAAARSRFIRHVLQRPRPGFYVFDWNGLAVERQEFIELPDPLDPYVGLEPAV